MRIKFSNDDRRIVWQTEISISNKAFESMEGVERNGSRKFVHFERKTMMKQSKWPLNRTNETVYTLFRLFDRLKRNRVIWFQAKTMETFCRSKEAKIIRIKHARNKCKSDWKVKVKYRIWTYWVSHFRVREAHLESVRLLKESKVVVKGNIKKKKKVSELIGWKVWKLIK